MKKDKFILNNEISRQCELSVDSLLRFSSEIENKAMIILGISVTIMIGLTVYLLGDLKISIINIFLGFLIFNLAITISFTLQAIRPKTNYRGIGIQPEKIEEFIMNNVDKKIYVQKILDIYKERFRINLELNEKKIRSLNISLNLFIGSPILLIVVFLGIKLLFKLCNG